MEAFPEASMEKSLEPPLEAFLEPSAEAVREAYMEAPLEPPQEAVPKPSAEAFQEAYMEAVVEAPQVTRRAEALQGVRACIRHIDKYSAPNITGTDHLQAEGRQEAVVAPSDLVAQVSRGRRQARQGPQSRVQVLLRRLRRVLTRLGFNPPEEDAPPLPQALYGGGYYGEDGGGGLLPLLLPPRAMASPSLSARCLGDQRAKAADENASRAAGTLRICLLTTTATTPSRAPHRELRG